MTVTEDLGDVGDVEKQVRGRGVTDAALLDAARVIDSAFLIFSTRLSNLPLRHSLYM